MDRTVGAVARLAKVSVRALHHYDAIGLLRPSERSEAGYRLYGMSDLERLQQILFFKELGFGLEDIRRIMNGPAFDRRRALLAQRKLLAGKARRTGEMLAAIDAAIEAMAEGREMNEDDMFEVFGKFDPREYEDEARERWGDTDAYKESAKHTASYTKEDWKRIMAEAEAVSAAYVERMDAGDAPGSPGVQAVVERHWRHICDSFYTCSPQMMGGLADLWVNDRRFTENIDKARPGLAAFQSAAVKVWAAGHAE